MIKSRISILAIIIPLISFLSCRDCHPTVQVNASDPIATPQEVEPKDILPLQISMQGLGQLSPVASRINANTSGIQVEILAESKTVHLSELPLDEKRFRTALATLQPDNFQQEKSSPEINEGIKYTLQTPLGNRTIYLDSTSPDTLVPESAVPLKPLIKLIDEWNKEALQEWQAVFVAKVTKERNIVEPITNFIEKGMTREEVLAEFPEPDTTFPNRLSYQNWEPALIRNAGRKGVFAININFEDGLVTSWSISSSG